MNKSLKCILQFLAKSNFLYMASKKIVDFHRNENNCTLETNGELSFIKTHGKNFKVLFDVGANIGEWTNFTSELIPDAKIYSFEPSERTYKILEKNTKGNTSAQIYNIGLGENNEDKEFYEYEASVLNTSIKRDNEIGMSKKTTAHFKKLDTFCEENNIDNISFLKIDTEGFEYNVLRGAEGMISAGKVDCIQFEYGGTYIDGRILLKDIFNYFSNKPYNIYKIMQNSIELHEEYSQSLENFQYSNYVAIKK